MIDSLRLERVQYVPKSLDPGILYVAEEYDIAVHLCACGCESKITTPLGPTEWRFKEKNVLPTLIPSIGNWHFPCRSHYLITAGRIKWSNQWSDAQVAAGRKAEQMHREAYYAKRAHERKWWVRFARWLRGLWR